MVIFLDGAGWAGSERCVRDGLRAAGFAGHVETFAWSSRLGPIPDHFLVSRKKRAGQRLAECIVKRRTRYPEDDLHLMALSAGSAVVVYALERLPANVSVNNVVLFAPSISGEHDLSMAMEHVQGCLYATSSPHDGILVGLRFNADGQRGPTAGLHGLRVPSRAKRYDLYTRVVNLSWRPAYAHLGWNGSHTGATGREFVEKVIGPRILSRGPHPLDRAVAPAWVTQWRKPQSSPSHQ
jgi:pimeloyl-ACP methyl ester carboxylesterase